MGCRGLLPLGLCACILSGCLIGKPVPSTSWLPRGWSGAGLDAADTVVLDVFVCEAIPGDPYIDQELWKVVDDQVLALEQKALLEQNGLRIGQIGGVVPARLQDLLTSRKACPDPRRIRQHCGKPTRIILGPTVARCRFQIHADEPSEPKHLEQAEFALLVTPTPMSEGRTRLRFTPEVVHGQAAVLPAPTLDRTGWVFQKQQPTEAFQNLTWEMTLGANEHAIVGGQFDRFETLGNQCFIRPSESPPRQRLLVIRAVRPTTSMPSESAMPFGMNNTRQSPPLALQAAWTTFRGVSP